MFLINHQRLYTLKTCLTGNAVGFYLKIFYLTMFKKMIVRCLDNHGCCMEQSLIKKADSSLASQEFLWNPKLHKLIYNGPTNALVCNKALIQMSHTKTLKITPTCFDHQMITNRELFDPG
jgi:hypothetical protein